jgi:hypothetical protein
MEDLERVREVGHGRVDLTVGSALDVFGGKLPYAEVVSWHHRQQKPTAGASGARAWASLPGWALLGAAVAAGAVAGTLILSRVRPSGRG